MRNLRRRSIEKKGKISIMSILFMFIGVYFVTTFIDQQISINRYNSQIEMYKEDIANKEALTTYYDEQQASVETDEYIEQVARDNLGLVKPYEKIFVDVNK
ncbi:MAG: septum formation initiator family protein [Clostridia bacterium]|nr:septum formation initiator family protein [Clostridia bacterium]MDD4386577.1 septum formation initiator family protein [Clostridia bacterium]